VNLLCSKGSGGKQNVCCAVLSGLREAKTYSLQALCRQIRHEPENQNGVKNWLPIHEGAAGWRASCRAASCSAASLSSSAGRAAGCAYIPRRGISFCRPRLGTLVPPAIRRDLAEKRPASSHALPAGRHIKRRGARFLLAYLRPRPRRGRQRHRRRTE